MNYSEKNPSAEILIKREDVLVALLKDRELAEAQELLQRYAEQERERASKETTPDGVNAQRLDTELELTELCKIAGFPTGLIIEAYLDLLEIANGMGDIKKYNEINGRLEELRNKNRTV